MSTLDELASRGLVEGLGQIVSSLAPPGTRWLLVAYAPGAQTFASVGSSTQDIRELGLQIGEACGGELEIRVR